MIMFHDLLRIDWRNVAQVLRANRGDGSQKLWCTAIPNRALSFCCYSWWLCRILVQFDRAAAGQALRWLRERYQGEQSEHDRGEAQETCDKRAQDDES